MGVKVEGEYVGGTRVRLRHEAGEEVVTVAPRDNRGDGSRFSPTDLVLAAAGSCILTTMSFVAENNGIDLRGARFRGEKIMQNSPRRVAELRLLFSLPGTLSESERKKLETTAATCPVLRSLHPEIVLALQFAYEV